MDSHLPNAVRLAISAYDRAGAASTSVSRKNAKTVFSAVCETLYALGYGNTPDHVEGVIQSESNYFVWNNPRYTREGVEILDWEFQQAEAVAERLSLLYRENES